MLWIHMKRDPGGGVSCHRLHPVRAIVRAKGMLVAAGLLVACGGNPVDTRPPGPNDACFGAVIALTPLATSVAVGDSVHVLARPAPAFTCGFSGVPFLIRWEASPDSAVVLSADSDTSTWIRGVTVGTVGVTARLVSRNDIFDLMTVTVLSPAG